MKFFILFICCFAVLSLLPFFWNHFQFIEFGYPFTFSEKNLLSSETGSGLSVSLIPMNLFYDFTVALSVAALLLVSKKYIDKGNRIDKI